MSMWQRCEWHQSPLALKVHWGLGSGLWVCQAGPLGQTLKKAKLHPSQFQTHSKSSPWFQMLAFSFPSRLQVDSKTFMKGNSSIRTLIQKNAKKMLPISSVSTLLRDKDYLPQSGMLSMMPPHWDWWTRKCTLQYHWAVSHKHTKHFKMKCFSAEEDFTHKSTLAEWRDNGNCRWKKGFVSLAIRGNFADCCEGEAVVKLSSWRSW